MEHLINGLQPGTDYSIQIRTLGPDGVNSPWSPVTRIHTDSPTTPPPPPTSLVTDFTKPTLIVNWTAPVGTPSNPMTHFEKYVIEFSVTGVTGTYETTQTTIRLPFDENKKIFTTPRPSITTNVYAVDTWGNRSTALSGTATNPVPGAVAGLSVTPQPMGYSVSFTGSTEDDYLETRIYEAATSGGALSLVAAVTDTTTLVSKTTFNPIYVKVCHADIFGQTGALSAEWNVTPVNPVVADTTAPAAPSGLTATNTSNDWDISGQTYSVTMTWAAVGDADLTGYYIRYGAYTAGNTVAPTQFFTAQSKTNSFVVQNAQAGQKYDWSVASFDNQNNTSAFTSGTAFTLPTNTTSIAAPLGTSIKQKDGVIYLNWPVAATGTLFDPTKGIGFYRVKASSNYTSGSSDATWIAAVEDGSTTFVYDTQSPSIAIPMTDYGKNYYLCVYAVTSTGTPSATVSKYGPFLISSPDLGSNLVMNGNLAYSSNYNWTSAGAGIYVPNDKPGGGGCLTFAPYTIGTSTNDDLIPVDPSKTYTLSASVKELTAPFSVTSASVTSNVATINFTPSPTTASVTTFSPSGSRIQATTSSAHGFVIGQVVTISGCSNPAYNESNKVITSTPTPLTFTYDSTVTGTPSTATATVPAIQFYTSNVVTVAGVGAPFDGARTVVTGGASSFTFNLTTGNTSVGAGGTVIPAATFYLGASLFDIDGLSITSGAHIYRPGSTTTLAAPLNPGDATVTVVDASGWQNAGAANERGIIFWDYSDSKGYKYPKETYSRNAYGDIYNAGAISGNVITLKVVWAGPAKAAGTELSNGGTGSTYKYFAAGAVTATPTWTLYSGDIGGVDYSGTNVQTKFSPGTAFYKVLILRQYPQTYSASRQGFGAISFTAKSDGKVPTASPNVSVGQSFQGLNMYWGMITNPDPVTYEVHISETNLFTPNAGTKVGETQGSYFFAKTIPGTTLPLKDTNAPAFAGYYVKVWAKDADGYSVSAGNQAGPVKALALEGPDLISSFFLADRQIKVGNNALQNIWLKAPGTTGNITRLTNGSTASGFTLPFTDTNGLAVGQLVTGTNIANPSYVASLITNTSVTLDRAITGTVANGASIVFKPVARLWSGPDTPGWNTTTTGFFLDGLGNFSLTDRLSWDGSTLNVIGAITASSGAFTGNMSVGVGGTMKFGVGAGGAYDGIYVGLNNYWYNSGNFSIGSPTTAERVNLCTNPSFETNVTNWGGFGGVVPTVAQSSTRSMVGSKSMLVTWPSTTAGNSAATFACATVIGQTYTISFNAWVPSGSPRVQALAYLVAAGGVVTTAYDTWQRLSLTFVATGTTTTIGVTTLDASTAGNTVYIDTFMVELSDCVVTYFDGTYPFAYWSGTAHNSTSTMLGGSIMWDGLTFKVDGRLVARSGTFNGNVEIQNGGTLFAKGGSSSPGNPATPGSGQEVVLNYTGIQGFDSSHAALFTLATTGTSAIGPWIINALKLTGGAGANEVGLSVTGASSIWAGGTQSAAPFRVTSTGAMFASAANISGGVITSSVITNSLDAGSITADKVLIGGMGTNMITDPGFESSIIVAQMLSNSNVGFSQYSGRPHSGVNAIYADMATVPNSGMFYPITAGASGVGIMKHGTGIPCKAGDVFIFKAWAQKVFNPSSAMRVGAAAFSATGAIVNWDIPGYVDIPVGTTPYTQFTAKLTVPTDGAYIVPNIKRISTGGSGAYDFDDFEFSRKVSGDLIVDGEITGTIITGATIRTASSGARVEISPSATGDIRLYTGDANETAPGAVDVNGSFGWATSVIGMSIVSPMRNSYKQPFISLSVDSSFMTETAYIGTDTGMGATSAYISMTANWGASTPAIYLNGTTNTSGGLTSGTSTSAGTNLYSGANGVNSHLYMNSKDALYDNGTNLVINSGGGFTKVIVGNVYGNTVTTPRNVFVASTGELGGISSSETTKHNIKPVKFDRDQMLDVGLYSFTFNIGGDSVGVINEQLLSDVPEFRQFIQWNHDNTIPDYFEYDRLVIPLMSYVQQQELDIRELKRELKELKHRL